MIDPSDLYPFCRVRVVEPISSYEPYKKGDEGVLMPMFSFVPIGMYFVKFDKSPAPLAVMFTEIEVI